MPLETPVPLVVENRTYPLRQLASRQEQLRHMRPVTEPLGKPPRPPVDLHAHHDGVSRPHLVPSHLALAHRTRPRRSPRHRSGSRLGLEVAVAMPCDGVALGRRQPQVDIVSLLDLRRLDGAKLAAELDFAPHLADLQPQANVLRRAPGHADAQKGPRATALLLWCRDDVAVAMLNRIITRQARAEAVVYGGQHTQHSLLEVVVRDDLDNEEGDVTNMGGAVRLDEAVRFGVWVRNTWNTYSLVARDYRTLISVK